MAEQLSIGNRAMAAVSLPATKLLTPEGLAGRLAEGRMKSRVLFGRAYS